MTGLEQYASDSIAKGSKSFARAARLFDANTRQSVLMLYAWCRYCDDVIDGQVSGHNAQAFDAAEKQRRLGMLQAETSKVFAGIGTEHPAFQSLQHVIRKHAIPEIRINELLQGFAMDVEERSFVSIEDVLEYCYHVAGVVGVIMAMIMGVKDRDTLRRAADLGLAFQLTNIARDVLDDEKIGRCYLPLEWLEAENIARKDLSSAGNRLRLHGVVVRLLRLADDYYASAGIGMTRLPLRSAWAIASALLIYRDIGSAIIHRGPGCWDTRVSTGNARKTWRIMQGAFMAACGKLRPAAAQSRANLWTKDTL